MLFNIQAIGNLGRDAEKATTNGKDYFRFSLAINESWKTATGEKKEITHWVDCVCWDERKLNLLPFLKKGAKIFVSGKPSVSAYTTQQGEIKGSQQIIVEKIELLIVPSTGTNQAPVPPPAITDRATAPNASAPEEYDDLPF